MNNPNIDPAEMEDFARDAMREDFFPRLSPEDVDAYARVAPVSLSDATKDEAYNLAHFFS